MAESSNKRRYPRLKFPKQTLVAWKIGTQKYVAPAENLGLGGLFIRTKNPPKAGTTLQLLFNTPEGEVRALATVRNFVPGEGMGVAIVSMEQDHRARLDRWLRQLAAKEELPVAGA